MLPATRLVGLDGCPGGWVAASCSTEAGQTVTFARVADHDLRAFLAPLAGLSALIAIDVPIGLADSAPRSCDQAARARLGPPRQTSVFSAPCRATLAAADYTQACAINRAQFERAISLETWWIMRKIALVDTLLEDIPQLAPQVWEAHPEVTFAELAAGPRGIGAPKKSAAGLAERLALLQAHGLQVDPDRLRRELPGPGRVSRDDIVDAAACLLTAGRLARGQATFFPQGVATRDACGRRMQIVA